jgi:glycosyltransferase involved in cell wall biosynthesis
LLQDAKSFVTLRQVTTELAVSVVIPAHNEGRSIARLLDALALVEAPNLDAVVVCNGCTDHTAEVARAIPGVRVFELPQASKRAALAHGDLQACYPTRAYIDSDVVISRRDLLLLVAVLQDGSILAAAPARHLDRQGVSLVVRWYYDVWERLPQVQNGLFGRGVVVLSAAGRERLKSKPEVMSDDLLMSEIFRPSERRVVDDALVTIRLPRTSRDLVRRRIRVSTGNAEMDKLGLRTSAAKTSVSTLIALVKSSPVLLPKAGVFLVVTLIARWHAGRRVRAGDFQTWLRDESSRAD